MFSAGPKSRTTAAYLAIFLGWAGLHKFYLGYRNVGFTHVALTAVGPVVFLAHFTAPDDATAIVVQVAAWAAILFGYFYVRRFHFGHTVDEILSPGRLLLWPWQLVRSTLRLTRAGFNMEEEERRRRRWRGRRRGDDDDDGLSPGCIVMALGILLTVVVVAAILFLYYLIFSFVGFIAIAASIAIGVFEGVIYLRKTDTEFQNEYVASRRLWF